MAVCLLPEKIEEFKRKLKTREIKIADLMRMSSEQRINILEEYAGSNAMDVNRLLEEKRILKNRELGMRNAIDKITQRGRYSPKIQKRLQDIRAQWKAKQQERIMSPKENETFLNSLADKVTGVEITQEEAKNLFDLQAKTEEKLKAYDPVTETWSSEKEKAQYGAQKVAYEKYFEYLKTPDETLKEMFVGRMDKFKEEYKEHKARAILDLAIDGLNTTVNNMISTVATLDNSFMGRQGLRTLYTHPSAWWNGAKNSFFDIAKTLGGQQTMDALMADIYSRPNYLNGQYHDSGLLNTSEEQFPSSLPERIPIIGRAFKASEAAFKGSGIRMRTSLYDLLVKTGTGQGVNFKDTKEVKALGEMINSLTARGSLTPKSASALKTLGLWAPKMLKSHIDVLIDPLLAKSAFARKQAAYNLLKIVGIMALIMMIANALKPGTAELNPTSSDFGKLKFGNTRFDFTGGAGSLVILAARLIKNQQKSTTGKMVKYGSGFGQKTRFSAVLDFLTNKVTPPVGAVIDFAKGIDRDFEKPTLAKEVYKSMTPIMIQNAVKLKDEASAQAIIGLIADGVGISSNTYQPLKKNK